MTSLRNNLVQIYIYKTSENDQSEKQFSTDLYI